MQRTHVKWNIHFFSYTAAINPKLLNHFSKKFSTLRNLTEKPKPLCFHFFKEYLEFFAKDFIQFFGFDWQHLSGIFKKHRSCVKRLKQTVRSRTYRVADILSEAARILEVILKSRKFLIFKSECEVNRIFIFLSLSRLRMRLGNIFSPPVVLKRNPSKEDSKIVTLLQEGSIWERITCGNILQVEKNETIL